MSRSLGDGQLAAGQRDGLAREAGIECDRVATGRGGDRGPQRPRPTVMVVEDREGAEKGPVFEPFEPRLEPAPRALRGQEGLRAGKPTETLVLGSSHGECLLLSVPACDRRKTVNSRRADRAPGDAVGGEGPHRRPTHAAGVSTSAVGWARPDRATPLSFSLAGRVGPVDVVAGGGGGVVR